VIVEILDGCSNLLFKLVLSLNIIASKLSPTFPMCLMAPRGRADCSPPPPLPAWDILYRRGHVIPKHPAIMYEDPPFVCTRFLLFKSHLIARWGGCNLHFCLPGEFRDVCHTTMYLYSVQRKGSAWSHRDADSRRQSNTVSCIVVLS